MPRKKGLSYDLRKINVAAYLFGKDYKAITKQFEIHHSKEIRIVSE